MNCEHWLSQLHPFPWEFELKDAKTIVLWWGGSWVVIPLGANLYLFSISKPVYKPFRISTVKQCH